MALEFPEKDPTDYVPHLRRGLVEPIEHLLPENTAQKGGAGTVCHALRISKLCGSMVLLEKCHNFHHNSVRKDFCPARRSSLQTAFARHQERDFASKPSEDPRRIGDTHHYFFGRPPQQA